MVTVRSLITLASIKDRLLHQMMFYAVIQGLYDNPSGFETTWDNKVCILLKSLNGSKQVQANGIPNSQRH